MFVKGVSKVYVVDDEELISESLALILRQEGFRASWFTDPQKALERTRANPPDLIISDVMMPGLSGIDLAIQVRESHPECKILLFSGQAATADLLQSAHARGHNFNVLAKPIHPTELLREIQLLWPSEGVGGGYGNEGQCAQL